MATPPPVRLKAGDAIEAAWLNRIRNRVGARLGWSSESLELDAPPGYVEDISQVYHAIVTEAAIACTGDVGEDRTPGVGKARLYTYGAKLGAAAKAGPI